MSAYWSIDEAVTRAHDRTLLASARIIGDRMELQNGRVRVDVPWVALDPVELDNPGTVYYRVTDADGHFVSGYDDFPPLPQNQKQDLFYPALVSFRDDWYDSKAIRVAALYQPIVDTNGAGQVALIQVGETLEGRQALRERLLLGIFWRQGVLVLAGLLILLWAISAALKPLQRLRGLLQQHSPEDGRALPMDDVPREIQPLAVSLNNYIERLDQSHEERRRFLADASHQLRTPLSVMLAQVEHALEGAESPQQRANLQALKTSIKDNSRLTNQLLALARAESGRAQRPLLRYGERVDITALVRQVCIDQSLVAVNRGLDLSLDVPPEPLWVKGDLTLLHEAVANLLDNAFRYTPAGGQVEVSVSLRAAQVVVRVADSGCGIPKDKRQFVLQRFARLSAVQTAGSGLGLSIVADVVHAHDGELELMDSQFNGLAVEIRLESDLISPAI